MDISKARDIALKDFDAEEFKHFDKIGYRVKPKKAGGKPGKVFMTLWLEEHRAVLMLTMEQQAELHALHPAAFFPHPSKWGAKGATFVELAMTNEKIFKGALGIARANAGAIP